MDLNQAVQQYIGRRGRDSKINNPSTLMHDHLLYWLSTGTSIKSSFVKLLLGVQVSHLSKMMMSCKCFPHVNDQPVIILEPMAKEKEHKTIYKKLHRKLNIGKHEPH
jgi:hypothetical protein